MTYLFKEKNMKANTEKIIVEADVLNVLGSEVAPLPEHVINRLIQGREKRTQILDGSLLEQHSNLIPYAYTHVSMNFDNEDDIIRCARMLQWSDERMRSRSDPKILWAWKQSFREKMSLEFSVAWYTKEFFEDRKDAFMDSNHASYYANFGLKPSDIKVRHEILTI